MKRIWMICICIAACAALYGCSKELKIVVEPMIYQLDDYKKDEDIKTVRLSVFFRSNTEVKSASLLSILDLQGEGLLDPAYVTTGFQKQEEVEKNEDGVLYQLNFNLNMKTGGTAKFTKLRIEVNGEDYEAMGEYQINLNHKKEDFIERTYDTGASVMVHQICLNDYQLPEDAENIRITSANSHMKVTTVENSENTPHCKGWVAQLDSPYKIYATTIQVRYESNGKMIQKYIPELRGTYENLAYQ